MPQDPQMISFPVVQHDPFVFPELAGDGRAEALLWDDTRAWAITRYAEARAVLASPSFSADVASPGFPSVVPNISAVGGEHISFLRMDPPRHDRLRRLLIPYFTFRRCEQARPRIREVVRGYLDTMADHGSPADVTALVAMPIPSKIICEMLDVPYSDHDFFQDRGGVIINAESGDAVAAAITDLSTYIADLVDTRAAQPGTDLISELIHEQLRPGALTRDELVAMSVLLLLAGHETTANMISLGVLSLIRRPGLAKIAIAGGDGLVALAEELLRFHSIAANAIWRVAVEDVRIGDRLFRAGEGAVILLDAANRDSAAFPGGAELGDRPPADGHLAFGHGVHQCLGQTVARIELQETLGEFFRRFSGARLAVPPEQVKYRGGALVRGLGSLPVSWDA